MGPGVSLPGPYYSKAYLQEFPLLPHQRVVTVRLRPYQHYGRHAPGVAFPGLTDGAVHADVFPYRYLADFVPPAAVAPPLIDECPHERKWPPPPARP